jgi:hypothetical protein
VSAADLKDVPENVCTYASTWVFYCITGPHSSVVLMGSTKDRRRDAVEWAVGHYKRNWPRLRQQGYRVRRLVAHFDD